MGQIYRKTFFKSEEGVKAFQDVGLPYEDERWDLDYAEFLKKTRTTPEKDRVRVIQNLQRVVAPDGKEYLVYDLSEQAADALGNRLSTYRGSLGCYHKPIPKYAIEVNTETGEKEKVTKGVDQIEECYSIPFTKEAVQKVEKYITEKTQFILNRKKGSFRKITIDSLDDFKLGPIEHLSRFGHRASDYEKQILAEEKMGNYAHHKPPNAGLQYR